MLKDVLQYEQARIDTAYEIAERLCVRLRGTGQGANQHSAHAARNERHARADKLEAVLHDPSQLFVYGRVDFTDGDRADDPWDRTIYIGGGRLSDEADDPYVVSWEAPMAEAFYDPANFDDDRAVELKRSFTGRDRTLESYADQQLVEGTVETAGADPVLTALGNRTSGELQQVVATIQAAQYELMARPLDQHLVVQGGPGTGKTIVGLHRVSVLLYRTQHLRESDLLVVGPSPVFMNYISQVLPQLGRTSVRQVSIDGLADHGVRVRQSDRTTVRLIKGAASMAKVIDRYLSGRIREPSEDLVLGPDARVSQSELQRYLKQARTSTQPYNVRRERLRVQLTEALGGVVGDRRPQQAREIGGALVEKYGEAFDNALDRLMPSRSPREVVHELLTGPKILAEAAHGILTGAEQAEIRRSPDRLTDHPWSADDLPLLDEAAFRLEGTSALDGQFQHILVDEAQDLSPMQLRMLNRRTSSSRTILGDLAQATSPWSPSNWIEHLSNGGIDVDSIDELTLSYRTSAPLLQFANRLLPAIDVAVGQATSVIEEGDPPALIHVETEEELAAQLIDVIESLQFTHEDDKVGVIGEEARLREVAVALEEHDVAYTWAQRSLTEAVTLVPASQIKGLEFEHTIVLAPEALYRSDPVTGARLLYVALTRARVTLTLLHMDRLPGPLTLTTDSSDPTSPHATSTGFAPQPLGTSEASSLPLDRPARTDASRYVTYCRGARGLVRVEVADERVSMEVVPADGGDPFVLAEGYAIAGEDATAWALVGGDGKVVSTTTDATTNEAAQRVVAMLDDRANG